MSNSFDFEIVASDQVSEAIGRVDEAIRDLEPKLNKTKEGLQLGGQETLDGLNGYTSRLELMARSARDNVQFIGDMVPPLKMVGEIGGKIGKIGLAGAVGYGLKQVAYGFREVSREAYNLDVSAKNAGMRIDEFSRIAGAMRILGADSANANASIEGFAKTLKEANSGSNSQALGALSQIGVQIQRNKDGSVNTLKTLEEIAKIFPTLRPEQQKSFADAVGFTPEMLALMREGLRLKELMVKSDKLGLTVDPELNKQLTEANRQMNEFSAAWDGLANRAWGKFTKFIMSPADESRDLKGRRWQEGLNEGIKYDGTQFYHGDREKDIRWKALRDKEFKSSLSASERMNFTLNRPDPEVEKKLNARYGATWQAYQLQNDVAAINRPSTANREKTTYNQGGKYDAIFDEAGKKYGIDPKLLKAVMIQESRGNPNAVSSAGAFGLMQIIFQNFKKLGITDWRDPYQNIMGGAQILAGNLQSSGGDVPQALRYYHGGYDTRRWGRVNQAYPGAVLGHYERLINDEKMSYTNINGGNEGSIIQPSPLGGDAGKALADNIADSFKTALDEQKLKLEITMVNESGERKTYNAENNGRITTSMNY